MVDYVGPERRHTSKDERRRFAEENNVPRDETVKITLSARSFAFLVAGILSISGGGSIIYQRAITKEPAIERGLDVRMAVVEAQLRDVKEHGEEMKTDLQTLKEAEADTNRLVRVLLRRSGYAEK